MLTIQRFTCNMFQENTYVVSDETGEAVVIDCGAFYEAERRAITQHIEKNGLRPVHLLATHGHIDHNIGNGLIAERYGLKPELHGGDEQLMGMLGEQANVLCGITLDKPLPPVGRYLTEADAIAFGTHTLTLVHTPGHSPGGVFYCCREEGVAFSGDTLFRQSIGRTDFWGGDARAITASLRKVMAALPEETAVLPGHGPQTTIGEERRNNPYLRMV